MDAGGQPVGLGDVRREVGGVEQGRPHLVALERLDVQQPQPVDPRVREPVVDEVHERVLLDRRRVAHSGVEHVLPRQPVEVARPHLQRPRRPQDDELRRHREALDERRLRRTGRSARRRPADSCRRSRRDRRARSRRTRSRSCRSGAISVTTKRRGFPTEAESRGFAWPASGSSCPVDPALRRRFEATSRIACESNGRSGQTGGRAAVWWRPVLATAQRAAGRRSVVQHGTRQARRAAALSQLCHRLSRHQPT